MAGACLVWAATCVSAMDACENRPPADTSLLWHDGRAVAYLTFIPAEVRVGEPFALRITGCSEGLAVTGADAGMPSHGHGMNYRPRVENIDDGFAVASGFLFHMPGLWEIRIEAADGQNNYVLAYPLRISP